MHPEPEFSFVEYPALQRELAGRFFEPLIEPVALSGKVQAVNTRCLETTIAWLCDRFYIDAEQAKVCNLHSRQETFDQEAFFLPPATRMLLATRRNPAAGHGRRLI